MPVTDDRSPGRASWAVLAVALLVGAIGWSAHTMDADRDRLFAEASALTGGDARRGPALIREYGCGTCHMVPGVDGASGKVGPPLAGIAQRAYIGGVLANSPENMLGWILDPKRVDSLTAMPNVGVSEPDARHIAAYLYTLR